MKYLIIISLNLFYFISSYPNYEYIEINSIKINHKYAFTLSKADILSIANCRVESKIDTVNFLEEITCQGNTFIRDFSNDKLTQNQHFFHFERIVLSNKISLYLGRIKISNKTDYLTLKRHFPNSMIKPVFGKTYRLGLKSNGKLYDSYLDIELKENHVNSISYFEDNS